MDKKDLPVIVFLFALLIGWMMFYPELKEKFFPADEPVPVAEGVEAEDNGEPQAVSNAVVKPVGAVKESLANNSIKPVENLEKAESSGEPQTPGESLLLSNAVLDVTVFSRGASIGDIRAKKYLATQSEDSGDVVLDFGSHQALSMTGVAGLTLDDNFEMGVLEASRSVRLTRKLPSGVEFNRVITLGTGYTLSVADSFYNASSNSLEIPSREMQTGIMSNPESTYKFRGMVSLGVDSYNSADGIKYWGKDFDDGFFGGEGLFTQAAKELNVAAKPEGINITPPEMKGVPVDWVAAKNKFFVQILTPAPDSATQMSIIAERDPDEENVLIEDVAGAVQLAGMVLNPNQTIKQEHRYYVGPKKYRFLKDQGLHQNRVMQLGWLGFIGRPLLVILNTIHKFIPNYGVAIILLTIMVRILFWPVTHKSTESMRKMQEIQPQVKELREKYKDDNQKMQQEMMLLYKKNKVNPLGGCLPILVQIPVFIALFSVLRSAIELRFASFLWISDLSRPENLFANSLPIALNILPLIMAGTMIVQQHLTPSAGDKSQKKMMMFMPVMMLFIFYKMPSGLVLYWTTSQLIMIIQLLSRKAKKPQTA